MSSAEPPPTPPTDRFERAKPLPVHGSPPPQHATDPATPPADTSGAPDNAAALNTEAAPDVEETAEAPQRDAATPPDVAPPPRTSAPSPWPLPRRITLAVAGLALVAVPVVWLGVGSPHTTSTAATAHTTSPDPAIPFVDTLTPQPTTTATAAPPPPTASGPVAAPAQHPVAQGAPAQAAPAANNAPAAPVAGAPRVPPPAAGREYYLQDVATGGCMGINDYDTPLQEDCGGDDVEGWSLTPTRTVDGTQLYLIVDQSTGECFDPPGTGAAPAGTRLMIGPCTTPPTADNQEFSLYDVGTATDGHEDYALVDHADGLCVDVDGSAAAGSDRGIGTFYSLSPCQTSDGWDDHLWIFTTP